MAVSNVPVLTGVALFVDTVNAATAVSVKASSSVIYGIECDNTANAAPTYTRLYNAAACIPGTTVPDWIIMTPANVSRSIVIPSGVTFATGLWCTSGTSATLATITAPSSAFILRLAYV